MTYTNTYVDSPERQCKGKRGYGSKSKAKRAGRRVQSLRGSITSLHVYRCPHCGLFHLGHRRRKSNERPTV